MKVIKPYIEVPEIDGVQMLKNIERAGRTCYKSESNMSENSYAAFIDKIVKSGHHSMFEHEKITVRIICDRGVSHEIVRHRLAAYSQESTRYCNYSNDKFGREITVIEPFFWNKENIINNMDKSFCSVDWEDAMRAAERFYFSLIQQGATPQEARSVLPNSLKTEIVVTYDLREWRHFFSLRCAKAAHPQMQQIAIPLMLHFNYLLYPLFQDIPYNEDFDTTNYAEIIIADSL